MKARARNAAIKRIVTLVTGISDRDVKCETRRGGGWTTITTPVRLPAGRRDALERELVARGLVRTFGDVPCVSFWSWI